MAEERTHSIYINISTEIADYLNAIYKQVAQHIPEKRSYDWSYHLNILSKVVDTTQTGVFFDAITEEFKRDLAFDLTLSGFSVRESGYVFFEPDTKSKNTINHLHGRTLKVSQGIGYVGYTPGKIHLHAFEPHLSLIKIPLEQIAEAREHILEHHDTLKMRVESYALGKQEINEEGRSTMAEVGTILLS